MFAIFVTLALLSDTSHIARLTHMNGNALYDTQSTIRLLLEHFLIPLSGIIMAMSEERREDTILLPHKWQKIGLALFVAGLVMYMCSMFLAKQSFVFVLVSTLVMPAGLTVAALSKEKADDERIDCIRFNALFKSVNDLFELEETDWE